MSLRLRPDQAQVVAYRKGYMAVPAVPGAGKTTVLAYLAADLIAQGLHQPGRILVVTYTNSAVANFRSRIGDFLEEREQPRQLGYEVRTIHSLAMNIVRTRPEALGWSSEFLVMDEARMSSLLERLTQGWIGQNRGLWESMLKDTLQGQLRARAEQQWEQRTQQLFRTLIQTFKSRRISPQDALTMTRPLPIESTLRWAAEIYDDYQRELAQAGAVDFGDLMLGAHQLLSQEGDLLDRFRQRWTYIFEDEAQDSYRLQEQVLRLLAGPGGNLVRVGDANQAIMGSFTSAEPDLFRRFTREPGVVVRPLTMAGRSSPDIIDLANELVRWSREEHPDPPCREGLEGRMIQPVPPGSGQVNPQPDGHRIVCRNWESQDRELHEVARLAVRSLSRAPKKSLAILLPTNAMVGSMVELLTAAEAPFRQLGGPTAPERLQTARDLLAILAYLACPHDGERLLTALIHLTRLDEADVAAEASEPPFAAFVRSCRPEELFFPLDDTPALGTPCAASGLNTTLGFDAAPAAGVPTASDAIRAAGTPIAFDAAPAAGAPTASDAIRAAGTPIAFDAIRAAGTPTAFAAIHAAGTPTAFDAIHAAGTPTAFDVLCRACPSCRGDSALLEALDHIARWLSRSLLPPDELLLAIAGDLGLKGEEAAIAMHLSVRLRRLLQESPGLCLAEATVALEAELLALGRFADMLYDRRGFKPLPGVIYVTTCHSAKGLEWDTVFIPALTRGEYPSMSQDRSRSELWFMPDEYLNPEALALAELDGLQATVPPRAHMQDGLQDSALGLDGEPNSGEPTRFDPVSRAKYEIINERMRLLYVAITRARENLMLSCHMKDRWGKPTYPALAYHHLKRVVEQKGVS